MSDGPVGGHPIGLITGNIVAVLGNIGSALTIAGAILGWIPVFFAFIGAIFYILQIYESQSFKNYMHKRHLRRILKAKADLIALQVLVAGESKNEQERLFWIKIVEEGKKILTDMRERFN